MANQELSHDTFGELTTLLHSDMADRGLPWRAVAASGSLGDLRRGWRPGDAPLTGPRLGSLRPQAGTRWDYGRSAVVDSVDDLARIDSLEINRGDPEVRVSELALDDRQGDPFVRHLDRVSMPQLVRGEPPPDTGLRGEPAQLTAGGCR